MLAQENANKGVNAIRPGYIATEMVLAAPKDVLEKAILPQIPVHRRGQPERKFSSPIPTGLATQKPPVIPLG